MNTNLITPKDALLIEPSELDKNFDKFLLRTGRDEGIRAVGAFLFKVPSPCAIYRPDWPPPQNRRINIKYSELENNSPGSVSALPLSSFTGVQRKIKPSCSEWTATELQFKGLFELKGPNRKTVQWSTYSRGQPDSSRLPESINELIALEQ